jgi:hypothetical protein
MSPLVFNRFAKNDASHKFEKFEGFLDVLVEAKNLRHWNSAARTDANSFTFSEDIDFLRGTTTTFDAPPLFPPQLSFFGALCVAPELQPLFKSEIAHRIVAAVC